MREPSRDTQLRCPFHERHEHGDMRKSARYYMDTNKIFCFTENKVWSPVDLFVEKTGKSWNQVASMLIKKYGDSVEDNAERLKQQITRSEQKSDQTVSFMELEDSFEESSVRRYISEMQEVAMETGMNLFHRTAETAVALEAFIKETKKEVQDGQRNYRQED